MQPGEEGILKAVQGCQEDGIEVARHLLSESVLKDPNDDNEYGTLMNYRTARGEDPV